MYLGLGRPGLWLWAFRGGMVLPGLNTRQHLAVGDKFSKRMNQWLMKRGWPGLDA